MERDDMIAAGFGYRQGATLASLRSALDTALAGGPAPAYLATIPHKRRLAHLLAQDMNIDLKIIETERLTMMNTLTQSLASLAAYGCGSVAEAAALAAAGPGARLYGPRAVSEDRMATCALAEGDTP
ncbi:cobalamin biosynthesis protein [Sulfitobacter sp. D35]|uniref:cobalamin biosynthesis protein n=1 Tax=Sulfitobacter sp. D35 TaxID=3083252 RepID=UPI00296E7698|nr:cobalamin biosynthesis protein [Sulfitobacter sp. D35]MDW4496475.1 cobalamin biosynthesis protein [Sulfitobacter sp. D35]